MSDRTDTATLTAVADILSYQGADYLIQLDRDAQCKQQRTRTGRFALARHAISYGITQHLTKAAIYRLAGHHVPVSAQVAGTITEIVLHAAIDDGRALAKFAKATGKWNFHELADHGINGRALMDQALHHQVQIPAGVAVTTLVATWVRSRKS